MILGKVAQVTVGSIPKQCVHASSAEKDKSLSSTLSQCYEMPLKSALSLNFMTLLSEYLKLAFL